MDYNKSQIRIMVNGAYKKLKSYYYYDKNFLYIKRKIAVFEFDSADFNTKLDDLSENILNENNQYFDELISQLDFQVFPKSMKSTIPNSDLIQDIDHNKNIEKINFYIDIPIELLIIDCLWTLLIAKISSGHSSVNKHSYAGSFKKSVFISNDNDLFSGIDYASNRCFEPYFQNYSRWQSDAFTSINNHTSSSSILLIGLDLTSFYYSVQFNFSSLNSLLNEDSRLPQINFLTEQIEKIYNAYTNKISRYKKKIARVNNSTIFPIGLLSPIVLRELYLGDLDNTIVEKLSPIHYGRYVDDMLLTIPIDSTPQNVDTNYVCDLLKKHGVLAQSRRDSNEYCFTSYPNITLQTKKISCFFFPKGENSILINKLEQQIKANSSEANLLPEFDMIKSSFNDTAYFYNSVGGSSKIRDIGILQSNNYNASKSITLLKQLIKNTNIESKEGEKLAETISEILQFYNGSSSIEFMSSWTSVFELLIQFWVLSNKVRAKNDIANMFYKNIFDYIVNKLNFDSLDSEEVFSNKKSSLLNRLKTNLKDRLDTSISLAMALDYSWCNNGRKQKKNKDLAHKFRKANLLNHNLVAFPLLNYLPFESIENISLISIEQNSWGRLDDSALDTNRLIWTPRFIHLDEFFLYQFIVAISNNESSPHSSTSCINMPRIYKRYLTHNNLTSYNLGQIAELKNYNYKDYGLSLMDITIANTSIHDCKYYNVGLANTTVTEYDALCGLIDPTYKMAIENKEHLYAMLNASKKGHAHYITFPEFYIPLFWMKDISRFSKENDITIVGGLRYLHNNVQAFNFTTIILPCKKKGYKNSVILFREKNFYAPEEKKYLSKLKYRICDKEVPSYFIIHSNGMSFSTILCYEFTDIDSRAALKSKIDTLFVPQLNRDTNYFSSIVESSARDLYCFIVQANTSTYGDSRIAAPYDTVHKNIVQIKGGENDIIIIGNLELDALKEFKKNYQKKLQQQENKCFNCDKKQSTSSAAIFAQCEKCENFPIVVDKKHLKNTPPRFGELHDT